MFKRILTFFASSAAQVAALEPLFENVPDDAFDKRWESQLDAKADVGIYCAHQKEISSVASRFAVIMLHELGQGRETWPKFWVNQPWDRFELGWLPGRTWQDMYSTHLTAHRTRGPRYGVHAVGWAKADALYQRERPVKRSPRAKVLLQFDYPHMDMLQELIGSVAHLPLDLICVVADRHGAMPAAAIEASAAATVAMLPQSDLALCLLRGVDLLVTDESSWLVEAAAAGIPTAYLTDWHTTSERLSPYPLNVFGIGHPSKRGEFAQFMAGFLQHPESYAFACSDYADWIAMPGEGARASFACLQAYLDDPSYTPAPRRAMLDLSALATSVEKDKKLLQRFLRVSPPALLQMVGQRFDEAKYRAQYSDVDQAIRRGVLPSGLLHWQHMGCMEGRQGAFQEITAQASLSETPPKDNYVQYMAEKKAKPQPRAVRPLHAASVVVIYTPEDSGRCGGATVLYHLCRIMRDQGVDARLWVAATTDAGLSATHPMAPFANRTVDPREAVVIYPEIVDGNPLGARHVVRWLLNRPGVMGKNAHYAQTDLIVHYLPYCAIEPDPANELCVHQWRPIALRQPQRPRDPGGCMLLRKGRHRPRVALTDRCALVDGKTPSEMQDMFESFTYFYSYDLHTYYLVQAALCGALSVAIPETGFTGQQWRQGARMFNYGVAYGVDEIPWAQNTRHLIAGQMMELERTGRRQMEALLARLRALAWWHPRKDSIIEGQARGCPNHS